MVRFLEESKVRERSQAWDEQVVRVGREIRDAEKCEYARILSRVKTQNEKAMVDKYLLILREFSNDKERKRQYVVARSMLALLTSEAREFVHKVLEENVFGHARLNAICRMEYFQVEITILLDFFLTNPRDSDGLEKAARNFQLHEVKDLVAFVAVNSPRDIVRRMMNDEVFRGSVGVRDADKCFSDERKQEFIEFVSRKLDFEVPPEARVIFAKLRLKGEFEYYSLGRTEFTDFYNILVAYANGDDSLLRLCVSLVAGRFNPLAEFLCSMIKVPFVRDPSAEDVVPVCIENEKLHDLACNRHHSLTEISSVKEFVRQLNTAENIAVYYHMNTVDGDMKCDFISLRVHKYVFHYSVHCSRPFKRDVIRALVQNKNKTVFVYKKEQAIRCLQQGLGWKPRNIIDAKDIATGMGMKPNLDNMTHALVGGKFCGRAMNFSGKVMPSQTALRHIDIMIALVRKFCIDFYRGSDGRRSRQQQVEPRRLDDDSVRSRSRH